MAHRIAQMFCAPGETVLVFGASSGSDALAFLHAGCNVVAIEKSARQFKQLPCRLMVVRKENKQKIPFFLGFAIFFCVLFN
jgi:hypothetical protein